MTERPVWLYSLSTCSMCKELKKELEKLKITFQTIEVDRLGEHERQEIFTTLKEYNPKLSFPTLVVEDEVVIGYNREKINRLLKRLKKTHYTAIRNFLRGLMIKT
ncbi:MAG: glutaredoxin family protein [Desulfobacterales bacterium]